MRVWQPAGQRKSNVWEVFNGRHPFPSRPHWLLAVHQVDVQVMNDSGGIKKDCARVKNARPMIYATAKRKNTQGACSGRVLLITVFSMGRYILCCPRVMSMSRRGLGASG